MKVAVYARNYHRIWPAESKQPEYLPNGASEFGLITLQKSVMGCSANLFFQYKMYL